MAFEQALERACNEYMKQKDRGLAAAFVEALFEEHLHVLEVTEYNGNHTVFLPGPGLFERRYGREDGYYWIYNGDDTKFANRVQKRREKWPKASGKDGLIYLSFKEGDGWDLKGRAYVEVSFDTYLLVPKNRLLEEVLVAPPGHHAESVTDLVWVYDQDGFRSGEELTNWSEYGRIRHIFTEGYSRFKRFPRQGEDPKKIEELIMWIPGVSEDNVGSVTPRIVLEEEKGDIFGLKYKGAPLGDGSLDAFFRHMEYDAEINRLVK